MGNKQPPEDVPRFTRFSLLNALYAGCMAGLMTGPMFIPTFTQLFDSRIMALGTIWAVRCSSLDFQSACSASWTAVFGSLVAAAVIAVVIPFATAICGGSINLYVCSIVMMPFCFAASLAASSTKCKLAQLYDYKTTLTVAYLVIFFGTSPLDVSVVSVILVGAWSTLIPLLITSLLNLFGALPRSALPPMTVFERSAASYLETGIMFILEGELHQDELERKRDKLSEARKTLLRSTTSPDLKFCIFRMSSLLYTLRRSSRFTPLNKAAVEYLWVHVEREIFEMVSTMVVILRHEGDQADLARLRAGISVVSDKIRHTIIDYTRGVAKGQFDRLPVDELIRMEHVMLCITRLAKVVTDYCDIKSSITVSGFSIKKYLPVPPLAWHLRAWLKEPMYPLHSTWFERFWFPARLTLSITVATLGVLGAAEEYPVLLVEGFWALMPVISCFLPTVGSTLSTAVRRFLGVMVGGGLAMIAVSVHPLNVAAFIIDVFLVAAVTRFLVVSSRIGYAAMQMFITFIVVGVVSGIDPDLSTGTRVLMAAERMLYTLIGVAATIVLSMLTIPAFICRQLAHKTADELRTSAAVLIHGISTLVECDDDESPGGSTGISEDSVVSTGTAIFEKDTARAAALDGAREESTLLHLVGVNASRCGINSSNILLAQKQVMRVSRCAMSACISLDRCRHLIGVTARKQLLNPARESLDGVACAMLKSSLELETMLRKHGDAARAINTTEELVEATANAFRHFERLHERLLFSKTWAVDGDVMDSTKLVEALSSGGGVGLHEALYAIIAFVGEWLGVVNTLLGCGLSVSLLRGSETEMKVLKVPTPIVRGRARAKSEQLETSIHDM
ncbi:hypothetical protein FOL47_010455 [Perkinsus chesapeaki]|uniref:Integral membrane bound transporter domain-containing protein n=1 Tax=Perkinsus chesapeaki TaxID=330153 RepID=A0A7J6MQE1_PERCH|nr:hypothetical protein FOL47_010455 [Perkinsus chesapeaki]